MLKMLKKTFLRKRNLILLVLLLFFYAWLHLVNLNENEMKVTLVNVEIQQNRGNEENKAGIEQSKFVAAYKNKKSIIKKNSNRGTRNFNEEQKTGIEESKFVAGYENKKNTIKKNSNTDVMRPIKQIMGTIEHTSDVTKDGSRVQDHVVLIKDRQKEKIPTTTRHVSHSKPKLKNIQNNSNAVKCPFKRISPKHGVGSVLDKDVKCQQHQTSSTACKYVTDAYKYQFENKTCGDKETLQICKFNSDSANFECDYKACGANFKDEVILHMLDLNSGIMRPVLQGFTSSEELNSEVIKYAVESVKVGVHYIFLSCGYNENKTQLILLNDRDFKRTSPEQKESTTAKSQTDRINVNIIWLDSISRAHFLRSLPKTVRFFDETNTHPKSKAEILDFELYQSVHGHTTENMFALFNGRKFPAKMTDDEKEYAQTNIQGFLEFVKKSGYEVLYQEDECWEGVYGMFTDLGKFHGWQDFNEFVRRNSSIDDTGVTHASCKIINLHQPKDKHVFNTELQTCYNGLNLDTYLMKYLSDKIKNHQSNRPLFSFSVLNVAHDPSGTRVQGVDEDLRTLFKDLTQAENTLTLMFSDHGNTYTEYTYLDIEGRYEMFHPALFMVIPDGVRKTLGHQFMNNLRQNQNRLFNLVDIHHTIKHVIDGNHPNKGILTPISLNRTCGDIPMSMPNLCVCDGWDSPIDNTTDLMPYVDFAIGHINNIISEASPTMKCKRLVPTGFQNVLQRKVGDAAVLSFDIITSPGHGSKNEEERISVEVSHKVSDEMKHFDTKLISYDRVSRFGEYRSCSDADMKFRYCVCDMTNQQQPVTSKLSADFSDLSPFRNEYVFDIFKGNVIETIFEYATGSLALLKRETFGISFYDSEEKVLASVTFEVINLSKTDQYEVVLNFDMLDNMKTLTNNNQMCSGVVKPQSMMFLCTVARKWSTEAGKISFSFTYKSLG